MDTFEVRKKEMLQPLLFEAGAGLMDCQAFEFGIALLLFHFSRLGVLGLDPEKVYLILEDTEKKIVGQLITTMTRSDVDRFGRDSVCATPSSPSSDPVLTGGINRYGRDSVYAAQLAQPSAPASANAAGLQRYGRDSSYAAPFQDGSAQQTGTAIGTTGTKGNGG